MNLLHWKVFQALRRPVSGLRVLLGDGDGHRLVLEVLVHSLGSQLATNAWKNKAKLWIKEQLMLDPTAKKWQQWSPIKAVVSRQWS